MKKFKKIIPALCLLLISAALLGGSTFAWFSMNDKVTANGMNVNVKSNTQFLVISVDTTLGTTTDLDSLTKTSGGIKEGETFTNNVYPCAKAPEGGLTLNGVSIGANKWYTANSNKIDNAASVNGANKDNVVNAKEISDSELSNYQLTYTFYIGLAAGSTEYTGKVTVAPTKKDGFANGVTAIVKIGTTEKTINNSTTSIEFESVTLKDSVATTVTVILYVDGNNESVKSQGYTVINGTLDLAVSIAV